MSGDQDQGEKQFEPTEQRLQRAREQGDVPRSTELNVAAMYAGAWLAFGIGAVFAVKSWLGMATRIMGSDGWPIGSVFAMATTLGQFASFAITLLAAVPMVFIIVALLAQRGLTFATKKLAPDIKRINPIKNAGQKFGSSGLVTFGISVGKAALVCVGGVYLFRSLFGLLENAAMAGGTAWVAGLGVILQRAFLLAIAVSAAFAVLDIAWKRFDHLRKNRMTRKEMQDEHKDSEGDPHMKAARRQRAVDIAMSQMLQDVETADVIIVNPTHYAVALKWHRGSGRAPICVAKGIDEVAARIRERASAHGVPIWSDPPSARAIHATVKLGEEIVQDHFAPVAAAIRFAEKMREKARAGW
ncbi:flagellar type III secretion system protein FlhB [Paracoccus tegillarcae]|uniref:Flagellar biosynthesis protein FlhB n=1 Tax=Paracoccus tegillarcae TaxID=1529068 RepID=A0A2K9EQ31_9RHOB|nr:flagellar type III secretion system protein FlhB [Paracoccus tegillarcae]AUH33765.1 flagellar biosynthesis protein FlhB [Paracoccus tegillarcae]